MGEAATDTKMRRNRQAGQALYLTAISLVVLIGMLGFGIDLGVLRYQKRLQQTAADAAAIAGASDLQYDNGAGINSAAQAAAAANGFDSGGDSDVSDCNGPKAKVGTICVQVNNPPLSPTDPHNDNTNYVEVLVEAVHPTYFARIFGKTKATVTARAVATNVGGGPNKNCLLSLSTVVVNGTINANFCSIIVNGELSIRGSGKIINATSIGAGECRGACSGVVTGIPAVADPLASLPTLPPDGCSGGLLELLLNFCKGTVAPGVSLPPLNDPSGLYIISGAGELNVGSNATVDATGETLYSPNGVTLGVSSFVTANAMIVGPLNVGANVTLTLGGSGNSPIKSAVLVE